MARLGDHVRIRTGKLDANAASENGQYPFFTCAVDPLRIDSYSHDCECVLVAGNGDLNVKYYDGKFDAYQRTYIIESLDKTILSVPYLFCFLDKYVETLRQQAIGGVIKYIKLGNLTEAEIPILSVEEQANIVHTIGKVNELIVLRKEQLAKLEQLVKSRFVEMFGDPITNEKGWPMVTIADVAEIRIGPFGTLLHKEDYISGGHALVNPSHIIDGIIVTDDDLTISDEKYEELSAYHLEHGDIVLGRRGEMGRCAVVYEDGLLCGTGSMIIRPNEKMKPYFLQSIISNPAYRKIIEDKAVGVTMMNLNVPIVSALTVPQLPVEQQEQFIAFMEQTDKSKLTTQASLDKLELLKKSLMQQHFG